MFILLVTAEQGAWDRLSYQLEASRFLEHTDDDVREKFSSLDDVAEELLLQMPALFAYESNAWQGAARIGVLRTIRKRGKFIQYGYDFDQTVPPIPSDRLAELLDRLGISAKSFEMTRTHVAIKQGDLYRALRETGLLVGAAPAVAPLAVAEPGVASQSAPAVSKKVFLVHGRDSGTKHEVARFLEQLGLEVVILHERANGGRTLISKFKEESADVAFAVILMTPDDVGGLAGSRRKMRSRARQNVLFEMGYFVGKMRPERVCALVSEGVERPSDYEGVVFEELDAKGAWKIALARELQEAGVSIDARHIFTPKRGSRI